MLSELTALVHYRSCLTALLIVSLAGAVGCQQSRMTIGEIEETPGTTITGYEDFHLSYETETAPRQLPLISGRIRTVSNTLIDGKEAPESFAEERWSRARFQLLYPHPDGSLNKGLARLIISRQSPAEASTQKPSRPLQEQLTGFFASARETPGRLLGFSEDDSQVVSHGEEIWELDLPKEEIDILLAELSHRGFFQKQERPRGEALVKVEIDNDRVSKRWTNEPRLEELMLQVYNEGRLSAFGRKAPETMLSKTSRVSEPESRPLTMKTKS